MISSEWECPKCKKENEWEGEAEDFYPYETYERCRHCGVRAILKGYIDVIIDSVELE